MRSVSPRTRPARRRAISTKAPTPLTYTGNLVRTGYLFGNRNSKADGSEKAWSQGQIFRINGSNATLFAVWTPHP